MPLERLSGERRAAAEQLRAWYRERLAYPALMLFPVPLPNAAWRSLGAAHGFESHRTLRRPDERRRSSFRHVVLRLRDRAPGPHRPSPNVGCASSRRRAQPLSGMALPPRRRRGCVARGRATAQRRDRSSRSRAIRPDRTLYFASSLRWRAASPYACLLRRTRRC